MNHVFTRIFFGVFVVFLLFPSSSWSQSEEMTKLRQLEEAIENMKRDILADKVKLRQLEEAALFGKLTETTAYLTFKNEAEGFFKFQAGEFYLNGKVIKKVSAKELESSKQQFVILDGEVPPGNHELRLKLTYSGKNKGPFTYVEDYKFDLNSKTPFSVEQGKSKAVTVTVLDKGYFKGELKDRLAIRYDVTSGS